MKPYIVFITGASGAGKTYLVKALQTKLASDFITCLYFDDIGVPSVDTMILDYGSPGAWQKAMTQRWVKIILTRYKDKALVILEGQINLEFIVSAMRDNSITNYQIILIDCDEQTRHRRLNMHREQPELINNDMDNWANFLREQAIRLQVNIIDTSNLNVDEALVLIKQAINRHLQRG